MLENERRCQKPPPPVRKCQRLAVEGVLLGSYAHARGVLRPLSVFTSTYMAVLHRPGHGPSHGWSRTLVGPFSGSLQDLPSNQPVADFVDCCLEQAP